MAVVRSLRSWQGWFALVLVWLVATSASAAAAKPGFEIAPVPAWVEPIEPTASTFARDGAQGGLAINVLDTQQMISEASDWRYIHMVEEITNEAGVATVGELMFEFSPPHERLVLHRVEIHRDGVVMSRLTPDAVQVLQRERSLESRIYDGAQTAVIVLPDVRVGDVIVRAYSLVGRNPVFGTNASSTLGLQAGVPIGVIHVAVASKRALSWHAFGDAEAPVVATDGAITRLVWHLEDVPAFPDFVDVPAEEWLRSVSVTTTPGWAEVGEWGSGLFRGARRDHDVLAPIVSSIAKQHQDPEARILAALRFVQDDIRYFGLSLAENSHRPADPGLVLERRFGDCKDKSQLAVALLRALGFDANVVLVTTFGGADLPHRIPNVRAFDHAIVAVRLADKHVFVDPTAQLVRGPLADGAVRGYYHGLLLDDDGGELVEIPDAPQSVRDVDATSSYAFDAWDAPVTLDLALRYGDGTATAVRNRVAAESVEAIRKALLSLVREQHPSAELEGEGEYQDFADARGIEVKQRFRISEWATRADGAAQLSVAPFVMLSRLPTVALDRTVPLALPAPLQLRHVITIRSPEPITIESVNDSIERGPLRSTYSVGRNGNTVRIEHTLDVLSRRAEVASFDALRADLAEIDARYEFAIWQSIPVADFAGADFDWAIAMVAVAWSLVVLLVIGIVHIKQPWSPRPTVAYEAGLVGVGGWMWLLALNVSLQPFRLLYEMWTLSEHLAGPTWHALTTPGAPAYDASWAPLLLFEVCANLTMLLLSAYLAFAFWTRRRSFPLVFVIFVVLSLAVLFVDEWLTTMLTVELELAPEPAAQSGAVSTTATLVRATLWTAYVLASSRVRSTFLPAPGHPAGVGATRPGAPRFRG